MSSEPQPEPQPALPAAACGARPGSPGSSESRWARRSRGSCRRRSSSWPRSCSGCAGAPRDRRAARRRPHLGLLAARHRGRVQLRPGDHPPLLHRRARARDRRPRRDRRHLRLGRGGARSPGGSCSRRRSPARRSGRSCCSSERRPGCPRFATSCSWQGSSAASASRRARGSGAGAGSPAALLGARARRRARGACRLRGPDGLDRPLGLVAGGGTGGLGQPGRARVAAALGGGGPNRGGGRPARVRGRRCAAGAAGSALRGRRTGFGPGGSAGFAPGGATGFGARPGGSARGGAGGLGGLLVAGTPSKALVAARRCAGRELPLGGRRRRLEQRRLGRARDR